MLPGWTVPAKLAVSASTGAICKRLRLCGFVVPITVLHKAMPTPTAEPLERTKDGSEFSLRR